jgi:cell division protein FtsL
MKINKKVSENVIISNFSLNCYFIIIIVINSNINIFILFKKKYSIIFFNDQIMKLRIQILRIKKFITNFQRKIKELLLAD